ncbi:MAG: hypothetical protein ACREXX_15555 [Gammaproteobacteria bacterium]
MHRRLLFAPLLIPLLFSWSTYVARAAARAVEVEPPQAAILAEDWEAIAAHAAGTEWSSLPPASRALTAHAFLLLNRNNEALRLFLSLDGKDRQTWKACTQAFVGTHPEQAVAHYLAGDALARTGEFDAALQNFDGALSTRPGMRPMKYPELALNAQGTVLAHLQRWDEARGASHPSRSRRR